MLLAIFLAGIVGITTSKVLAILEISEVEKQVEALQDDRSKIEA
ncbi:hypothetical protein ACJROX_20670 [Pseudalkalibacillus sp. A8]